MKRFLAAALAALLLLTPTPVAGQSGNAGGGCGLAQPAFCDPLNTPTANGSDVRSGDLNGVVWGVSRGSSADNTFQGGYQEWFAPSVGACGQSVPFNTPDDLKICNGQLFETMKDGGASAVIAMYPRQPFDIAGRTGTVAFDLSADGLCNHCAWPVFEYTDQPVPAPSSFGTNMPRNGFGFTLYQVGVCPTGQTGVGDMSITTNYVNSAVASLRRTGCVNAGSAGGPLNHFELRVSPTHAEVWGSDPGAGVAGLRQLAVADLQMPLTRGLVWMEDTHYNANKDSTQGTHTFAWANFGFDGPVLPHDLGYDVPDANPHATTDVSIGYQCFHVCNLSVNRVGGIGQAAAALLEMTWTPHNVAPIVYSVNGHPYTLPWPFDTNTYTLRTIALPVNVGDLVTGTNKVTIDAGADIFDIANLDIILVGAGGTPPTTPTSVATATNTTLPTATPTDTAAPTQTGTPTVAPTATATVTITATATDTPVPAATPTLVPTVSTPTSLTCPGTLTITIVNGQNVVTCS